MGKLEKEGLRLLNEKELLGIQGGRSDLEGKCVAQCCVCGWSSGWKDFSEVEQLVQAHTAETGHTEFAVTEPNL